MARSHRCRSRPHAKRTARHQGVATPAPLSARHGHFSAQSRLPKCGGYSNGGTDLTACKRLSEKSLRLTLFVTARSTAWNETPREPSGLHFWDGLSVPLLVLGCG